ncbi:MAG: hypothetical protein N2316_11875 [Spirochaetes bacterium]|nr:hypothetical protein [Spirochaetota bacterium]
MSKKRIFFIVIALLIGFYCVILGESGLIERYRLHKEKQNIYSRIQQLEERNRQLRLLKERYEKGNYFAEDLFRAGYVNSSEKVLLVTTDSPSSKREAEKINRIDVLDVELKYLRIFWGLFSVAVLTIFIIRMSAKKDE